MGLLQPVELGGGRRPQEMEDQMGFAFHNIGELCPTLLGDSDLLLHSYETGSFQQENDFTFQPLLCFMCTMFKKMVEEILSDETAHVYLKAV